VGDDRAEPAEPARPHDLTTSPTLSGAGYVDGDPTIHGFGMTHLSGVGCPELGAPVIAATSGALSTDFEGYGARFSDERAWAGYYGVELADARGAANVRAELTAARRAAVVRLFSRRDGLNVIVDAARPLAWGGGAGRVRVVSRRELEGEVQTGAFCAQRNRQTVYFVVRADADSDGAGTIRDDVASAEAEASGWVGGWLKFPSGRAVELAVGVSYVSVDGARANLEAELAGRRFDDVRRAAEEEWEATLGRVRVDGGTDAERRTFYTALYHALLHPSVASDADGSYRTFGGERAVAVDAAHERHHVFSLWDTYRTVHPLLALAYPTEQRAFARSLLAMTVEAGAPPMWELAGSEVQMMVGDPAAIVLADSAAKGALPDDADGRALAAQAFPLMVAAASDDAHRPGGASYRTLGYVPIEESDRVWGPVSTTLEYALADFALGRLGASLGVAVDPALATRAGSWRALVDPETALFRPRRRDGSFVAPFDPDALEGSRTQPRGGGPGFVEGTAWHYAFFAPHAHALAEHAAATGGLAAWVARLQAFFDNRKFAVWNEPDLAFPWHFTHVEGEGWRSGPIVSATRAAAFTDGRDGLPGNDDAGTMSAWYVLAALGLFPDVPGTDEYAIGPPLFDRATLALDRGTLVIEASRAGTDRVTVAGATLDGRSLGQRVRHADLARGGTLRVDLR